MENNPYKNSIITERGTSYGYGRYATLKSEASIGFNLASGEYLRVPLTSPKTILKVKDWKRRNDYDIIVKNTLNEVVDQKEFKHKTYKNLEEYAESNKNTYMPPSLEGLMKRIEADENVPESHIEFVRTSLEGFIKRTGDSNENI